MTVTLIDCYVCSQPSEVRQRFRVNRFGERVERVVLVCLNDHWVSVTAEELLIHTQAEDGAR